MSETTPFLEFTENEVKNREEIDKLIDQLQDLYHGRVFVVSHEIDVGEGFIYLNVSLAPYGKDIKNYLLTEQPIKVPLGGHGVHITLITDEVKDEMDKLMDLER